MIDGLEIDVGPAAVWLRSRAPLSVLGSAVVGGDLDATEHVVNMHVSRDYQSDDPATDLRAFARGLGEFGATIVLAGNTPHTRTIPIAIYGLLDAVGGEDRIVPLVVASVALSVLALFGFEVLVRAQRRRLELDP